LSAFMLLARAICFLGCYQELHCLHLKMRALYFHTSGLKRSGLVPLALLVAALLLRMPKVFQMQEPGKDTIKNVLCLLSFAGLNVMRFDQKVPCLSSFPSFRAYLVILRLSAAYFGSYGSFSDVSRHICSPLLFDRGELVNRAAQA